METRRFVSKGRRFMASSKIHITQDGYETSDPKEIEFLINMPEFKRFFFEVKSEAALEDDIIAHAEALKAKKAAREPVVADAIEPVDIENEEDALEKEELTRQADIEAEAAAKAARAAKRESDAAKRSAGRPKKVDA